METASSYTLVVEKGRQTKKCRNMNNRLLCLDGNASYPQHRSGHLLSLIASKFSKNVTGWAWVGPTGWAWVGPTL